MSKKLMAKTIPICPQCKEDIPEDFHYIYDGWWFCSRDCIDNYKEDKDESQL